jgi:hypothetical protein
MGVNTARVDTYAFALGSGIAGLAGCALSQIGNVGPDLGQAYIVDSFMVVVLGGVGQLAGTVYAALGLGILNKFIEGWAGAVLAKIAVLVLIVVFIQKRPQGCSRSRAGARKHERGFATGWNPPSPPGGRAGWGHTRNAGAERPHPNPPPRGEGGRTCCRPASRCSRRTGWTAFLSR